MRFQHFALSAVLFGSSAIATLNERFVESGINPLTRRQQFVPTTTTAQGETCADAFGAGYVTCREKTDAKNRLCYNPEIGQTCCSGSWACPSGSFCLVEPNCCPAGSDPKTCAEANGVSISSDFKISTTATGTAHLNGTIAKVTGATTTAGANYTPSPNKNMGSQMQANIVGAAGLLVGAAALL